MTVILLLQDETISHLLDDIFNTSLTAQIYHDLAGVPMEILENALPPCIPSRESQVGSSRAAAKRISLLEVLKRHEKARSHLARMSPDMVHNSMFAGLRLAALGQELSALEELMDFGIRLTESARTETINLISLLLLRCLLGVRLQGMPEEYNHRYREVCLKLPLLVLGAGVFTSSLPRVYFRACGLARRSGDARHVAMFELLIGSVNICNTAGHGNPLFHAIMARGCEKLMQTGDMELLVQASPYIGIFHYISGNYQQAINLFSLGNSYLQKTTQKTLEMFCLRHWSSSAHNIGDYNLALGLIRSKLRQLSPRSDNQLARSLRGQLAVFYMRIGQLDKAIEQLDNAIIGISPHTDIVGWVTISRFLASYHLLCGNISSAYSVLRSALVESRKQGYERPVYMIGTLLELLYAFREAGLPPLPCYSLENELDRCLIGPNRLLQGTAARLKGLLLLKQGDAHEAVRHFSLGLKVLRDIGAQQEIAKVHLDMASMFVNSGEVERALVHVLDAWSMRKHMDLRFWPENLYQLVPSSLKEELHTALTPDNLLDSYRELSMLTREAANDPETYARTLLAESCRILGSERGYLFNAKHPHAPFTLLAATGNGIPEDDAEPYAALPDLMHLVMEGAPLILDKVHIRNHPDQSGMLVGIPIDCRPDGIFALCHDRLLNAEVRMLVDEDLLRRIGKILEWEFSRIGNLFRKPSGQQKSSYPDEREHNEIISVSSKMERVLDLVDRAAPTDASVLLTGETGVGKEMIARRIHGRSGRRGRLVMINAASLSDELLENELFGHEKGSFTGAISTKQGLMELAHNGTLFLDEITESSPRAQTKLLRVLQERTFYRVGGTQPINVNFRLIAASNKDILQTVRLGHFRQDLYYRVGVICLHMPPLRERPEDILAIAHYYLRFFAHWHNRDCPPLFSLENRRKLMQHSWIGNVRELRNVIEQSVVLFDGRHLEFPAPMPPGSYETSKDSAQPGEATADNLVGKCFSDMPAMDELERRYLKMVLDLAGWRIEGTNGALEILKMKRSTLYDKIRRYRLRESSQAI